MTAQSVKWFWYASPQTFYPVAGVIARWCGAAAAVLCVAGLYIGFFVAPTDAQQGEAYRIIFIHVPAAWMSMFIYVVMAFWAAIGLAFNTRLSHMMASALAPTGALFSGTRRRAARDRRRCECPDHLLLGTVVEHAAPGRVRQPDPGAEHGGDDADRHAGHGACLLDVQHRGNVAARALSYPGEPVREFFAMGGYGLYVWGAYGVTFLLIGVEIALLVNRSRKCSETKT